MACAAHVWRVNCSTCVTTPHLMVRRGMRSMCSPLGRHTKRARACASTHATETSCRHGVWRSSTFSQRVSLPTAAAWPLMATFEREPTSALDAAGLSSQVARMHDCGEPRHCLRFYPVRRSLCFILPSSSLSLFHTPSRSLWFYLRHSPCPPPRFSLCRSRAQMQATPGPAQRQRLSLRLVEHKTTDVGRARAQQHITNMECRLSGSHDAGVPSPKAQDALGNEQRWPWEDGCEGDF